MAVGVVTNTEIEDATPAGMVAHTRRRSDYEDIVEMFYKAPPDVMMGGGAAISCRSRGRTPREDEVDYVDKFKDAGYASRRPTRHGAAAADIGDARLLGLFNDGNMDGVLDRRFLKRGTASEVSRSAGPDPGGARRVAGSLAQRAASC